MVTLLIGRQYLQEVPGIMESARRRLWVVQYHAEWVSQRARRTSGILVEKLVAKLRDDVDVRLLLNGYGPGARLLAMNRELCRKLGEQGLAVRLVEHGKVCHAKLVLVDGRLAVVGSHNWSPSSMDGNHEVSVVVGDPAVVGRLEGWFRVLWERAREWPG